MKKEDHELRSERDRTRDVLERAEDQRERRVRHGEDGLEWAEASINQLEEASVHASSSPMKGPATWRQRTRAGAFGWWGEPGSQAGAWERSPLRE